MGRQDERLLPEPSLMSSNGGDDLPQSRMTQFQEGGDDEDITPLDVPADPPTVMQGPMTRARMR